MTRVIVAILAFLSPALVGLAPATSAGEPGETDSRGSTPIAWILASPDRYGEKKVVIRGVVMKKTRAVFPNGRAYSTLLVGNGEAADHRVFLGGRRSGEGTPSKSSASFISGDTTSVT